MWLPWADTRAGPYEGDKANESNIESDEPARFPAIDRGWCSGIFDAVSGFRGELIEKPAERPVYGN